MLKKKKSESLSVYFNRVAQYHERDVNTMKKIDEWEQEMKGDE